MRKKRKDKKLEVKGKESKDHIRAPQIALIMADKKKNQCKSAISAEDRKVVFKGRFQGVAGWIVRFVYPERHRSGLLRLQ